MKNKMQEAIAASQQEVISAAEQKLRRPLSSGERRAIERINSLMILESCCRSFSSPASTQAQVLADLERFAAQA